MTKLVIMPQALLTCIYNFQGQISSKPKQEYSSFYDKRDCEERKNSEAGSRQQAKDEVIFFGKEQL